MYAGLCVSTRMHLLLTCMVVLLAMVGDGDILIGLLY